MKFMNWLTLWVEHVNCSMCYFGSGSNCEIFDNRPFLEPGCLYPLYKFKTLTAGKVSQEWLTGFLITCTTTPSVCPLRSITLRAMTCRLTLEWHFCKCATLVLHIAMLESGQNAVHCCASPTPPFTRYQMSKVL